MIIKKKIGREGKDLQKSTILKVANDAWKSNNLGTKKEIIGF